MDKNIYIFTYIYIYIYIFILYIYIIDIYIYISATCCPHLSVQNSFNNFFHIVNYQSPIKKKEQINIEIKQPRQ